MIELQFFDGRQWKTINTWAKEWQAWASLGGDDFNFRTVDELQVVLTDKSGPNYTKKYGFNKKERFWNKFTHLIKALKAA
jgi:hypothetical protein